MQETRLKENREVSREEIERRAFEIYVESGMEGGHDVEHWLLAEQQLLTTAPESGPTNDIHVFDSTPAKIGKAAAASGGSSSGG
jgi:hypothetical protein